MSVELIAALIGVGGAVVGAGIAILGGVVQMLLQNWLQERGQVSSEVASWAFEYSSDPGRSGGDSTDPVKDYPDPFVMFWIDWRWEPYALGSPDVPGQSNLVWHYMAEVAFFNHKDVSVGAMRLSVVFLRGTQRIERRPKVMWHDPRANRPSTAFGASIPGQTLLTADLREVVSREEGDELAQSELVVLEVVFSDGQVIKQELARANPR